VRRSDLENSSVAVAANRLTTTPANAQYSAPTWGYGLNAAVQGKLDAIAWEAGVDMRIADGTEHELFRFMNGVFTRNRDAGGETFVGGGYLEAAYDRGPWIVTGGVRLDYSDSTSAIRAERDAVTKAITLNQATPNRTDTTPTGRFGVRYQMSDGLYVRSAAYAGFRPPTLNELHRPFRVGNDITEANPLLKPETLQGIEAGIGGEAPFRWSGTVFYNLLKDPITNVTIGVGPGILLPQAGFIPAGGTLRQRQNAGEIEAWGVEGEASGDVAGGLGWRLAGGYTDAEVHGGRSAPQLTGLRPAQTPKWTVTAGFDWRSTDLPLSLSANLRYESGRWEDDLNSRRLSAGATVDARAGWRLNDAMEVYVSGENLFDEKLEVGETADGTESFSAPRTIRIGFSYRR
jgi:outer membrane receptor protein involved in Fe transport